MFIDFAVFAHFMRPQNSCKVVFRPGCTWKLSFLLEKYVNSVVVFVPSIWVQKLYSWELYMLIAKNDANDKTVLETLGKTCLAWLR